MNPIYIIQIIVSVLLISTIQLQAKGTGMGPAWGGSGGYHTRRGFEKVLLRSTIFFAILFVFTSLFALI